MATTFFRPSALTVLCSLPCAEFFFLILERTFFRLAPGRRLSFLFLLHVTALFLALTSPFRDSSSLLSWALLGVSFSVPFQYLSLLPLQKESKSLTPFPYPETSVFLLFFYTIPYGQSFVLVVLAALPRQGIFLLSPHTVGFSFCGPTNFFISVPGDQPRFHFLRYASFF